VVALGGVSPRALLERHGGASCVESSSALDEPLARFVPVDQAGPGDLAPLLASRFAKAALAASERGAWILADEPLVDRLPATARVWSHPFAGWAMSGVLGDVADLWLATERERELEAKVGEGCVLGPHVVLSPRVVLGARVRIDASSVIGRPGFGWVFGPNGAVRAMPQLGGVVIEDDVVIGPLCTVDAGTLSPTRIRRGAKLDAHVHVAHNCDIGEGTIIAAQSGFAGSVIVGRGVLVGGQVGVADHCTIGDGARIAAKSGVIGDVPEGAVVAGYPAVPRTRWLRALGSLYRRIPR
jgi:UDP-3-O-[3-hydroxymyristoyl] glucosamine N-acyltransferase